jgi:hypothetical protein
VARVALPAGAACSAAARARPPQKRPSFGVRSRQLHLCFIVFRRDRAMDLFLALFWCAAVARAVLRYSSRLSGFNSRLGPNKFPFSLPRELAGKGLICPAVSRLKPHLSGTIEKIPGFTGITRNFAPGETGGGTACSGSRSSHPTKPRASYRYRSATITPSPLLDYLNAPEH